ncbi:hypothetical protein [Streptomyces sp. NPDC057702]|uniref:hypothetical protein n=1 Tax=unclassified Streptomyces TaxID=2593676 RepID=UPI0036BBE627
MSTNSVSTNRVAPPTCLPAARHHRPGCGCAYAPAYAALPAPTRRVTGRARPPYPRHPFAVLERLGVRSVRLESLGRRRLALPRLSVRPAYGSTPWRRATGGAHRADRPAWQSPYGPASRRSHRGRWVPEPGVGKSLPTARPSYLCDRCG